MRRLASVHALFVGGLLLGLLATPAAADLATGRDRLIAGKYVEAISELSGTTGGDRAEARLLLARAERETGALEKAEATARSLINDKNPAISTRANVELAKILVRRGKGAEALTNLVALNKTLPADRMVRHALSVVLASRGKTAQSRGLAQLTIDDKLADKIDLDDADQLFYLAEAARMIGEFDLATQSYQEAYRIAPQLTESALAWADLFLGKYSAGNAESTLDDILKINPHEPDANAMMAALIVSTSYDLERARLHLGNALEVDPAQPRALAVRASIEIDRNEWDTATATTAAMLKVNPEDTMAMAQQATVAWLRDDMKAYEALRRRALTVNPEYSEFYGVVGRSAEREHRYLAAVELGKEAVALVPDDYGAMGEVGLGYLRLGNEKDGKLWLDRAWAGDEYNVRVFNTRNLYSDVIAKQYLFRDSKHFRFRYHKEEEVVLNRYITPTLERAFVDMAQRYGFTPKTPVIVEVYADSDAYAIRTVGLPNLGALGVCFGQVITALSPSTGNLNWGMVLWHELAHVFAVQLSNSRVPRFFTEGLSEYETLIARPEWRRENDSDLYGALVEGKIPSVVQLNHEFMQPDQNAVVVAYYMSAVTIEYIAQTYGFDKIVDALKRYGKGEETPTVIPAITGRTIAQFDADFLAYLKIRLAPYAGTFHLPRASTDDITALEIAAEARPKDAQARVNLALARYAEGDAAGTKSELEAALKLNANHPAARYLMAELTLRSGDTAGATKRYRELLATGVDNFDIRVRLASIAQAADNDAEFVAQLCAAKRLDPERSYPYQELAEHYLKKGDTDKYLVELSQYAMLEQMELAPVKTLTLEYAKQKKWAEARTYGVLATYIAPSDPDVLLALGNAYNGVGDSADALYTFDTALLLVPQLRRPALAHLGRATALAKQGKKSDAKAALARALKTEPGNPSALELSKQLK